MRVLLVAILLLPILVQGASDAANDVEYSEMIYGQGETPQASPSEPPAYLDILEATATVNERPALKYAFWDSEVSESWFDEEVTFDVQVAEKVDRTESRFPGIRVIFSLGGSDFMIQTTDGWSSDLYRFEQLPYRSAWKPFEGFPGIGPFVNATENLIRIQVDLDEFFTYFNGREIAMENIRIESFQWVGAGKSNEQFETDCSSIVAKISLSPCVGKFHDRVMLPDLPLNVQPTYVIAAGQYPLGDFAWWKGVTYSNMGKEAVILETSFRDYGHSSVPVGDYPHAVELLPGQSQNLWIEVDYHEGQFGELQPVWGDGNISKPFPGFSKYGTGVGGLPPEGVANAESGLGPRGVPEQYASTSDGKWFSNTISKTIGSHLVVGGLGFLNGLEYPDHFIWEAETTVAAPVANGEWSVRLSSMEGETGEVEYALWARHPHDEIKILTEGVAQMTLNGATLSGQLNQSDAVSPLGLTIRSESNLGSLQFLQPLRFSTQRPASTGSASFEVERFELYAAKENTPEGMGNWTLVDAVVQISNYDGSPTEVTYTVGNHSFQLHNESGHLSKIPIETLDLNFLLKPYVNRFSSTENPYLQLTLKPEIIFDRDSGWNSREDADEAMSWGLTWTVGPLLLGAVFLKRRRRQN